MRLFCRFFGHRRSKGGAWPVAGHWRSHCSRCGIRLIRLAPGKWTVFGRD